MSGGQATTSPPVATRRIRGLDAGERQAQRRRQLLDASLELFAAKGFANTSIEQICQTAFVGTRSFYEIFDGKESCYLALLDEIAESIGSHMQEALDNASDDEAAAGRALVTAFAHAVVDDTRIVRATFGQAGGISPTVDEHRRANRRWAANFLETVWRRHGLVADHERIHAVAVGVIAGLFDLVVDWVHASEPSDPDELIADLIAFYEVCRDGLLARR